MLIVAVMRAKPSRDPSHQSGSGGIVVFSSCLDRPRVHRPADSAWMETRVDSRQPTGARTADLFSAGVPGRARPGRITALHMADVHVHTSRIGRAAPDIVRSVCNSQRIGEEDQS